MKISLPRQGSICYQRKILAQKKLDLCTESSLKDYDYDDDDDDDFELDFVSSPNSNNSYSSGSKKINTEDPNANRFSDMNTGIQVAQCLSPTIKLNSRPSDTNAPFPDEDNLD